MDLYLISQRIMNAETPKDGEAILREAIKKLIGKDEYSLAPLWAGQRGYWARNELRHELLASIQPKEIK